MRVAHEPWFQGMAVIIASYCTLEAGARHWHSLCSCWTSNIDMPSKRMMDTRDRQGLRCIQYLNSTCWDYISDTGHE